MVGKDLIWGNKIRGSIVKTGTMKWNRISENMYSPKISHLIPPTSAKLGWSRVEYF